MKAFLDTSVLVAAFYKLHHHHDRSILLLSTLTRASAATAAHCLAETYAVTTRMPGKYRTTVQEVGFFLGDVRSRLTLVALSEDDYINALGNAAQNETSGGAIYDALIARCALKAKAQVLYTWNIRHFQRHEHQIAAQVREP